MKLIDNQAIEIFEINQFYISLYLIYVENGYWPYFNKKTNLYEF